MSLEHQKTIRHAIVIGEPHGCIARKRTPENIQVRGTSNSMPMGFFAVTIVSRVLDQVGLPCPLSHVLWTSFVFFRASMIFPTSILLRARIVQKANPQLPRFPSHHSSFFGPSQVQYRRFGRFFRPGPKVLAKVETPGAKRAYGERVLVYYAGRRIVFVATLKLATLFVFSFCTLIAAPSVGVGTEYGYWAPICSQFSIRFFFF